MARSKGPLSDVAASIKRRGTKGVLRAKAQRQGKSVAEYCRTKRGGTTGRQCGMAKVFAKYRRGGRS